MIDRMKTPAWKALSREGNSVVRAWFGLTRDEKAALLLVLALLLLGLWARTAREGPARTGSPAGQAETGQVP